MNQVFDANKKQPHGTERSGALQAKKEKKNQTEKEKDAAVKNTNIGSQGNLHIVSITAIGLFGQGNALQFEVVMDLVSHPQRADEKVSAALFCVR